ncbi:MAG: hypothetical protein HQK53_14020 [Oligoflexia bacterium]|nr:hypothetical protein [Oligoflexia bacterium]
MPHIKGESAIKDILNTATMLSEYADYFAINLSCPNTCEGSEWGFSDYCWLKELLWELRKNNIPLLLKISSDLS